MILFGKGDLEMAIFDILNLFFSTFIVPGILTDRFGFRMTVWAEFACISSAKALASQMVSTLDVKESSARFVVR